MKFTRARLMVVAQSLLFFGLAENCLAQATIPGELGVAVVAPGIAVTEALPKLSPLGQVERRLMVYEERLVRWRELAARTANPEQMAHRPTEWGGCYSALEGLVGGYGRLLEQVAHHHEAGLDPWQVMGDDIAFLEGECPRVYQRVSELVPVAVPEQTHPDAAASAAASGLPVIGEPQAPVGEQEQLEAWNRAVVLFDAGKYDEAIPALAGLVNTSYGGAAKERLLKAQTEIAKQLRSQAAGIFVKVRKAETSAQKCKLLEESWTLLNIIVTSYPEIAVIDKVKQNLGLVEEQLKDLDPALLQRLKNPTVAKN